jgi:GT2 family glycosyltransferase
MVPCSARERCFSVRIRRVLRRGRPSRTARVAQVVDFLAGACLLVRRRAFNEVGGFDAAYWLGYYEDADLCLVLTARGYCSMYEPRSTVTHLRGRPGRTLLKLALRNRALFE